ncbi:MAG TPA: competence/damage-inducible protein A [Solirubrobacteraceae bacterium]|nr:competence/damage-inducible protein A [Solirubrobacteraceae bacterium]
MQVTVRAGIIVTGTEVLTGVISDRNGPWLSDRLRDLGVDLAHILILGDRREDMAAALSFMRDQGMSLVVTSGGLGPTADDLTAEVVGEFQGREMVLDEPLEQRIAEILKPLAKRFPHLDMEAIRHGNRKQAIVPAGARILDPVGTAPGLVVPPIDGQTGPTVLVLPGPPRELQPMWHTAVQTEAMRAVLAGAGEYRVLVLRMFGIPESEIAETLRVAEREGIELERLEITTCLRRGEIEVVTRYEPSAGEVYEAFEALVRERHSDTLFSDDGSTIDEQVAGLLRGHHTIAIAESCTGGLLAARLTDPPGASGYVLGGIVAYANSVKTSQAGVDPALIAQHGAVSTEIAQALADGARIRLGTDIGVGITGIAGPGGGSEEKPVGFVCFSVAGPGDNEHLTRSITLPGGRPDIRDRATTVAMHLIRRALLQW